MSDIIYEKECFIVSVITCSLFKTALTPGCLCERILEDTEHRLQWKSRDELVGLVSHYPEHFN